MPDTHAETWMKNYRFFYIKSISMTNIECTCNDSKQHFKDFPIDELGHEDMASLCTMLLRPLKSLGRNPQMRHCCSLAGTVSQTGNTMFLFSMK